jgi:alpha-amylase
MSGKRLLLGLYDQKPLGTRKEDLEYSLFACYKPLLTFLYANPEIRISLYFSGIIYMWLEAEHPEVNMLIADMVKRRQIELLTGGFYDPILTVIPMKDRSHQIEKSTTFIRKRFGLRPRTAWITEQVWSPSLVNTLALCGIRSAFQHTNEQLAHQDPFNMQEMGRILCIFPVHSGLTEQIHENDLEQFSKSIAAAEKTQMHQVLSIMIDMGKLISHSMLTEENTTLALCHTLAELGSDTRAVSLELPYEQSQLVTREDFLPAGWYNSDKPETVDHYNEMFLAYPEIKHLYGKMLYSSKLIPGIKKEKTLKKLASKHMLMGESFGSFSQSQSGGFYQNYLRKENYAHLIEVDKISREKGIFTSSITTYDIDFDNVDEFIYRGKNITAVFDQLGGQVTELDYLVNSWNYLDTFVGREADIISCSIDTIRPDIKQNAFSDILFEHEIDPLRYDKYASDGVMNLESVPYDVTNLNRERKELSFSHEIILSMYGPQKMQLTKSYTSRTNSLVVNYRFENTGTSRINRQFGSEFNLSFSSDAEEDVSYRCIDAKHERMLTGVRKSLKHVKLLKIEDTANKAIVSVYADRRFTIAKEHYLTTVPTAMGEEEIYQYTRLLCYWNLEIEPGEIWETEITLRIEKMK